MQQHFLDVCTCFDDDHAQAALVLFQSLVENRANGTSLRLHAITTSATFNCSDYFQDNESVTFLTHNVENPFGELSGAQHVSEATYLRFLIADFVKAERALYLDTDIVVNVDLAELFETDLRYYGLAAVPDYSLLLGSPHWSTYRIRYRQRDYEALEYFRTVLNLCHGGARDYLNAGVLLFSIESWKKVSAEVLRLLYKVPDLAFRDQDALSCIISGAFVRLDPRYNAFSMLACPDGRTVLERIRGVAKDLAVIKRMWRNDPWIVHYAGSEKPWLPGAETTCLEHIWWSYALRSPAAAQLLAIRSEKPQKPIQPRKF